MSEVEQLAEYIQARQTELDLRREDLPEEYFYSSLPLCVIDAVFSLGIRYESTKKIVSRWCEKAQWKPFNPPVHSIDDFISMLEPYAKDGSFERLSTEAFSKHRTSPKNGILKTEAVYRFAKVLSAFGIQTRKDIIAAVKNEELEKSIRKIPGQQSGLSHTYFLMLAGSDNFVKADRHVRNFVSAALGLQDVEPQKVEKLLVEASGILKNGDFPNLAPRLLDYLIWDYQRGLPKEQGKIRKFDTHQLLV